MLSLVADAIHEVCIAFLFFKMCFGHPMMTIFVIGCERLHFKISLE